MFCAVRGMPGRAGSNVRFGRAEACARCSADMRCGSVATLFLWERGKRPWGPGAQHPCAPSHTHTLPHGATNTHTHPRHAGMVLAHPASHSRSLVDHDFFSHHPRRRLASSPHPSSDRTGPTSLDPVVQDHSPISSIVCVIQRANGFSSSFPNNLPFHFWRIGFWSSKCDFFIFLSGASRRQLQKKPKLLPRVLRQGLRG